MFHSQSFCRFFTLDYSHFYTDGTLLLSEIHSHQLRVMSSAKCQYKLIPADVLHSNHKLIYMKEDVMM